jgi:hypothetical protein
MEKDPIDKLPKGFEEPSEEEIQKQIVQSKVEYEKYRLHKQQRKQWVEDKMNRITNLLEQVKKISHPYFFIMKTKLLRR